MPTNELQLREFAANAAKQRVTEIVPRTVYHVAGFGHSNATFVIAANSVILIDTLDSDARGQRLLEIIREYTDKPIRTIIYTHGHPDHRGGAGSLIGDDPEIIAFAPVRPPLGRTEMISDILAKRGARQFGYNLTDEQVISQGLGLREGHTQGERYAFVQPTTIYSEPEVTRSIDGIDIELVAAPGETDDTIFVWLPEYKVICSGDNYYACWPNLAAIRGHQYRDVDAWINSLQSIRDKNASALLPGHFDAVLGDETVRERLTHYKEALEFVLDRTLQLLNEGLTPREVVSRIHLPEHLAGLEYLQEFYGTIEWSVYGIFSGYIGWFDGNPSNLHPLAMEDRAARLIKAMGGKSTGLSLAESGISDGEYQWALELTDLVLAVDPGCTRATQLRVQALLAAAENEKNATARNYYLSCAEDLG